MEIKDILKKELKGNYEGYCISSISKSLLTIDNIKGTFKKLKRIPKKISYFLHREKIKEAYKTDFNNIDLDYYLIISTDGTIFHIDY